MAVGWPGRGVMLVCLLAGCGGQPLAPPREVPRTEPGSPAISPMPGPTDAAAGTAPASGAVGSAAVPAVQRARTSVLTSAPLWDAQVLGADGDGIYWVSSDNRLWILPAWSDTARVLADDPNPPGGVIGGASLLVRGNYILWSASVLRPGSTLPARPLHRTLKTGSDSVLFSDGPALLAADAAYLYSLQGDADHADLAIVALPLDADPGAAPLTLTAMPPGTDVSALAVDDENVYWTECAAGSTMFEGTGPIFGGGKANLLRDVPPTFGQLAGLDAYVLVPSGGRLYFDFAPTPGSVEVGVADGVSGPVAIFPLPAAPRILPLPAGRSLVAFDGWMVSSTAGVSNPGGGEIYAAEVDGRDAVQIADDVLVPPVAGLPGLVFVDGTGHLVAVSAADLGAAVAAGQR